MLMKQNFWNWKKGLKKIKNSGAFFFSIVNSFLFDFNLFCNANEMLMYPKDPYLVFILNI